MSELARRGMPSSHTLQTMFRRLTALSLAITHAVLLSATSLHRHGPETTGIDLANLPAEYHHHNYMMGQASGEGLNPLVDDCIGCLLQRTVALPLPAVSGLLDWRIGDGRVGPPQVILPAAPLVDLLPRAPPV